MNRRNSTQNFRKRTPLKNALNLSMENKTKQSKQANNRTGRLRTQYLQSEREKWDFFRNITTGYKMIPFKNESLK